MVAAGLLLGSRHDRELDDLERRLVPRLELGPRLLADLERLRRAMQDAVSAQDHDALAATIEIRDALVGSLDTAGPALHPVDAERIRGAVHEYHRVARDISLRLIEGEGGE